MEEHIEFAVWFSSCEARLNPFTDRYIPRQTGLSVIEGAPPILSERPEPDVLAGVS